MRRSVVNALTPEMTFDEAAAQFMAIYKARGAGQHTRRNTEKAWDRYAASLSLFFGPMPLKEIHWYKMLAYQKARVNGDEPFVRYRRPQDARQLMRNGVLQPAKGKTPCPIKPQQVNQEMCFLKKLKLLSLCWTKEDDLYFAKLQREETDTLRALTPEQQAHWLDVSRSRPEWEIIHWYSLVAFDTLMSTNEMRLWRVGDTNMHQQVITVPWPSSKNKFRMRTIAIESADALWAMERLLVRAANLGSTGYRDYVFPFQVHRNKTVYPNRPMTASGLKSKWQQVREASQLLWFRPYDTRHTGGTRYAENGTPVPVIMARMGHASVEMQAHYTHISEQAQRRWARGMPDGGFAPRHEIVKPYQVKRIPN